MKEKWRSCRKIGFPNYAVSNKGRVKNTKLNTLKKNLTRAESHYHQGKQTQ